MRGEPTTSCLLALFFVQYKCILDKNLKVEEMKNRISFYILSGSILFTSTGCFTGPRGPEDAAPMTLEDEEKEEMGKLFDHNLGSISLGNIGKSSSTVSASSSLSSKPTSSVHTSSNLKKENLWRASLKELSFLPIANFDEKTGVILSDWQATNKAATERMKVTVNIDNTTKAALKVNVLKQEKLTNGEWGMAVPDLQKARDLEIKILKRAR